MSAVAVETPSQTRSLPGSPSILRAALRQRRTQAGLVLTLLIVALAIFGPLFAPYSPREIVGATYAPPSSQFALGTDYLGHDVLSQLLNGGRTVVGLSLAATVLGVGLGLIVGLIAGYSRTIVDDMLMGAADVVLAFPQIVLVLLFVSILGPKIWLIVVIVGTSHSPRVARLARSITLDLLKREFVESSELLGIGRRKILTQEILPNLMTPVLVEFALRLTWSVGLIAGLSFLGYGIQPPSADWGLMINENRDGLTANIWGVLAPVVCIFLFTVGTNLLSEGLGRTVAGVEGRRD